MKIIDIIEEEAKFRFITDNPERPEFVYRKNKFKDLKDAVKEIEKSINLEKSKKEKIKVKIDKVKDDWEKEKVVEEPVKEPIEGDGL